MEVMPDAASLRALKNSCAAWYQTYKANHGEEIYKRAVIRQIDPELLLETWAVARSRSIKDANIADFQRKWCLVRNNHSTFNISEHLDDKRFVRDLNLASLSMRQSVQEFLNSTSRLPDGRPTTATDTERRRIG